MLIDVYILYHWCGGSGWDFRIQFKSKNVMSANFVLSPKPAIDGDNGCQVIQTKEILWVAGKYEDSIQQPSPD